MNNEIRITFIPENTDIFVLPGTVLAEAAFRADIIPDMPCGGQGTCGKCLVLYNDGAPEPTQAECDCIDAVNITAGYRLACKSQPVIDCTVHIPPDSRRGDLRILAGSGESLNSADPATVRRVVTVSPAAENDAVADAGRVLLTAGATSITLNALRTLPAALRKNNGTMGVVLHGTEIIATDGAADGTCCFGVALDIGTTTMAAALVDLADSRTVATAVCANPQDRYGVDVISRIGAAGTAEGLQGLHVAVTGAVNGLLDELCLNSGALAVQIHELTVTGNTAMQHLFMGVTPQHMGMLPFSPVFIGVSETGADRLGLRMNPDGTVWIAPAIAGFVGGDTIACLLTADFGSDTGNRLMVDIGTNGEIVLEKDGVLTAASAAAGPAFEGARIARGMRAGAGAIEKVSLTGDGAGKDIVCNVIGSTRATGLCGSGLLDAVAVMLETGVIDMMGRIQDEDELAADMPQAVHDRILREGGEPAFRLSSGPDPVVVTQKDIRELQLGKAAIRAGIDILLEENGLSCDQLDCLLLAGGFGNFIRRRNALALGLLPPLAHEKIMFIGNGALAGAKIALVSRSRRTRASDLAARTRHIDLSQHTGFQMRFAEAMLFC